MLGLSQFGLGLSLTRRIGAGVPWVPARRIIWDTDLDSDIDDVCATAVLLDMIDQNEAPLIAATLASNNSYAADAMRKLLDFAGYATVPIGAYKGTSIGGGSSSSYTLGVANTIPPALTRTNYPDALTVLVEALTASPDQSVILAVGGTGTNIAALIQAEPALVAAKVQRISIMGGYFPSVQTQENNVFYDVPAANVIAASGIPVSWAGYEVGNPVLTRIPAGYDESSTGNPYALAWDLYGVTSRPSWDLMSVLEAVRDEAGVFTYSELGDVTFSVEGYTNFTPNPSGKNRYLIKTVTDAALASLLNGMIDSFMDRHDDLLASDVTAPTITSANSVTRPENAASTFTLTANETVTWSIVGDPLDAAIAGNTLNLPSRDFEAGATYALTIRATDAAGNTTDQSFTDNITDEDETVPGGGIGDVLVAEWLVNDGAGQYATDATGNGHNAVLGYGAAEEATDPAWSTSPARLYFNNEIANVPPHADFETANFAFLCVVRPTSVSSIKILASRDESGVANRAWQFRTNAGKLELVLRYGGASAVVPISATTNMAINQPYLATLHVNGLNYKGRVNGVTVVSGTLPAAMNLGTGQRLSLGARINNGIATEGMAADLFYAAYAGFVTDAELLELEQRARDAVALKGITV